MHHIHLSKKHIPYFFIIKNHRQAKQLNIMTNTRKTKIKWYAPLIAGAIHLIIVDILDWIIQPPTETNYAIDTVSKVYIMLMTIIIIISYIYILIINRYSVKTRRIIYFISICAILIIYFFLVCLDPDKNLGLNLLIWFLMIGSYQTPFFYLLLKYDNQEN